MAKPTKIQKLMDERPDLFDFSDVPPDRVKIPAQEKWYADNRPQWAKDLVGEKGG